MLPSRRAATASILAFVALMLALWVVDGPFVGGDTQQLIRGADAAIECLEDGTFSECGLAREGERPTNNPFYKSEVGPWPPLQYVPAAGLLALGASHQQVLTGLALLSVGAMLAMLWLSVVTLRRLGRAAFVPVIVLVLLSGPLLLYAGNTFGEALAAGITLALCSALLLRASWPVVFAAACATATTKETAAPFALALAAVILLGVHGARGRELRPQGIPLAAGLIAGVAANAALNVFRFGTLDNDALLQSFFRVHGVDNRLDFFLALHAAPNGGVIWFWPLAVVVLFGLCLIGLRDRGRPRWPALLLLGAFFTLQAGLASYHEPFGWHAWGPRLTLPWVPAFVLVAVALYGEQAEPLLRRATATPRRVLAVAGVVTVFALPQLGVALGPSVIGELFTQDEVCARKGVFEGDEAYDCIRHQAWGRRLILVSAVERLGSPAGVVYVLGFGAMAIGATTLAAGARARPRSS